MVSFASSQKPIWCVDELRQLPDCLLRGHIVFGSFDGVHLGHRAVIDRALKLARVDRGKVIAVTFEPRSDSGASPDINTARLTSTVEKSHLLTEAGASQVVNLDFDRALETLTIDEFVNDILVERFKARSLVTGEAFYFDRHHRVSPAQLAKIGADAGLIVDVIRPLLSSINGESVSSTAIRVHLAEGNISEANRLLGRRWTLDGTVVHGDKRGRELGFPTANIVLESDLRLAFGIYAVRVLIDGRIQNGVASYGRRPQFDNGAPRLEIHLLDFSGDLYGKALRVEFVAYQRPELTFTDVPALLKRMDADCAATRRILDSERSDPGIVSVLERRIQTSEKVQHR
jgi:riboflavin kinase/FMN adenylyltransferase